MTGGAGVQNLTLTVFAHNRGPWDKELSWLKLRQLQAE